MDIPFYNTMQIYAPRLIALLRAVRRDGIDVIHLTTPGPIGLAALFVAWRTHIPMVGSFHTDLAAYAARLTGSKHLGVLMREYLRWPYGRCARILVPSENTRRLLLAARMDPARIDVWPRGVDSTRFTPHKRSAALRERWRVCDRRPALIYVGRLSREKGLDLLPAFQSALHRRGIEHRLVLVGDGPMRKELEQRCPDAVFTGTLEHDDVATALASADLFVFPSDSDSAGNVVLEAQASGLPVLVSERGGPSEYIRPGVTGIICRSGDGEAFAHEAALLVREGCRRRAMAEAARQFALTLRWESALAPLYRAYREVLGAALQPQGPASTSETSPRNAAVA
jgi:glycosyltransferase involved in cell wall biosynthesis